MKTVMSSLSNYLNVYQDHYISLVTNYCPIIINYFVEILINYVVSYRSEMFYTDLDL